LHAVGSSSKPIRDIFKLRCSGLLFLMASRSFSLERIGGLGPRDAVQSLAVSDFRTLSNCLAYAYSPALSHCPVETYSRKGNCTV
jgi:hypothetical protein